jgi:uracil permease
MESKVIYAVNERPPFFKSAAYGLQHLLACFGATVLVPILVGIPPERAIFSAGVGTLVYLVITKFRVPNFTGSSFAFIAVGATALSLGEGALAVGALASMVTYGVVSFLVWRLGTGWVDRVLPPPVIGSVVAIIGLSLAGTAVAMAFQANGAFSWPAALLAAITLGIIFALMYSKNRFASSVSILLGLAGGYVAAAILGAVFPGVFGQFLTFKWPDKLITPPVVINPFIEPKVAVIVALSFIITSFATICEHIGHTIVTGDIVGVDIVKDPGLHRTILGDGVATGVAGIFGSVCNTTYGESLGVLATTRVYSVWVFVYASVIAILLSLFKPFGALVQSLPTPVLGGACILLYGIIASQGFKQLVKAKVDFDDTRNLIIVSVIFVLGIGGAVIPVSFGGQAIDLLSSIALAAVVGIVLNLALPKTKGAA